MGSLPEGPPRPSSTGAPSRRTAGTDGACLSPPTEEPLVAPARTGLPMHSMLQPGRRNLTNAKRAPALTVALALCMLASFFAALERQASARTETEDGSAVVRSGDGLVRARYGCALVENGDWTVAAGSCGEQQGPSEPGEPIPPPEEATTSPETAPPEET